jgi:hypothetical protein
MKHRSLSLLIALCIGVTACNNSKETPESIARKWCELNSNVAKAATPQDKEIAKTKRTEYERSIEEKYKGDEEMKKKVEAEVNKCEAASEGRE